MVNIISLLDPRITKTQLTQEKVMKKLAFLIGIFLSMSCYGNDKIISNMVSNSKLTVEEANQIYALEQKYAEKYDIPIEIGLAISLKESTFNSKAKNSVSYGLKQINYKVWAEYFNINKKCLLNVECNIKYGYLILQYYVELQNGDIKKAIMSYRGSTNKSTNKKYLIDVLRKSELFG